MVLTPAMFYNLIITITFESVNRWRLRTIKVLLGLELVEGVGVQYHGVTFMFNIAIVTLRMKILSGLYLRNCKV